VAVKVEPLKARHPQLEYESRVYRMLRRNKCIAPICFFGQVADYNVMVIGLLGPSLEDLFQYCGKRFSLKTTIMLALQMLECIETLHSKHIIHRDLKPENFMVGIGSDCNRVHVIDFGLSKVYRDNNNEHIPYRENKPLTGTARYASINAHQGVEQSRRDDLEALSYVLLYFLRGRLPWQSLKAPNRKQKFECIKNVKLKTTLENLCVDLPQEFIDIVSYARQLRFDEEPSYSYIRKRLTHLFQREGFVQDYDFDWKSN